ncbi:MAG: hypothetical protein AAF418_02555 [Pseudomonadota bacterium]
MENKVLIADLVSWIAQKPRPYRQVMEAWRTSCPKLPIWEDAVDAGLVERTLSDGSGIMVKVTAKGRSFLEAMQSR